VAAQFRRLGGRGASYGASVATVVTLAPLVGDGSLRAASVAWRATSATCRVWPGGGAGTSLRPGGGV